MTAAYELTNIVDKCLHLQKNKQTQNKTYTESFFLLFSIIMMPYTIHTHIPTNNKNPIIQ